MSRLPRLLFCAPASGGGKTTVTCAVLQALVNRGEAPAAFKCGPDYIDPMFHSRVIGVPACNLDLFLMGEGEVRRSLWEQGRTAGVSVIEGAMGYYDGIAMGQAAGAYDLARVTQTPAVLVIDGRGAALSLAALVKGFQIFRPDSRIEGVILNRISPMLYPRLKEQIELETGVQVYGFLPNLPSCGLESRHLGLVTAAEVEDLREKLSELAEEAERSIDLDGLLALASRAPELEVPPAPVLERVEGRPRIAVAQDKAFCFYYAGSLDLLECLGAELVPFSPLEDTRFPEGVRGLYLGGGYPEVYAEALAANGPMLDAVRAAVISGMPVVAECGGFLYLHQTLSDADGRHDWPMTGVFSMRAWNAGKLNRFGYVTLTAKQSGLLCEAGASLPAHEFHYYESEQPGEAFRAQKPQSSRSWNCGWHTRVLYAGFPHIHFCGCPDSAQRFVAACAAYDAGKKQ